MQSVERVDSPGSTLDQGGRIICGKDYKYTCCAGSIQNKSGLAISLIVYMYVCSLPLLLSLGAYELPIV